MKLSPYPLVAPPVGRQEKEAALWAGQQKQKMINNG